jgi:hypothetical protein
MLLADDPFSALQHLLGQEPQTGKGRRPEDHTDRDVRLAAIVAELRDDGRTVAEACEEARRLCGTAVHDKTIEAAYYKHRDSLAVRAVLAFRQPPSS